ncbi:hypothetical protein EB1_25530 [Empedobacter brevis NBRC 14943 = ATCC 43319]|uniref:Uncharacterized protein n=1 Tax=Empedobacter brevis NBRC 14943 = ATCC 43319 TaxID=1218108 RepID=A0A511NJ06_9FLAO|nr:GNAT family N-acetyltransferase [Empedobacter brevis]GEM52763.1 hypothetical protein EB1_25530 [Empedobacter brevis NBRC 14943 = ATCC 43319]
MTNESLQTLLSKLNDNDKTVGLIYTRPLSEYVDFAKIWLDEPKMTDSVTSSDGPDTFYLIKNTDNNFVAIVFDMFRDLHWYVLSGCRGKGYLTEAMQQTIIPHLFFNRDEQRITINENEIGKDNFIASEKVALRLGFIKSDKNSGEYFLSKNLYTSENFDSGKDSELSYDRMIELKNHINYLGRSLWTIHTEIEMKFGKTDYSDEIKDLVYEIRSHTWKLEDFYWDLENKIK